MVQQTIVNPILDVRLMCEEGGAKAVTLRAPVKAIEREHDPEFFGLPGKGRVCPTSPLSANRNG
jgi:hypothetical protein